MRQNSQKMDFRIKKKYGQHFLKNKSIIKKIANIESLENKFVIEIGPGLGSLTKEIISQNPKKLICIEKDVSLKSHIEHLFNKNASAEIIFMDALKVNFYQMFKNKKTILIGNLPYNIATTLIINWIRYVHIFKSIVVMVQKEVAERLIAKASTSYYSRISVLSQSFCSIKKIIDIDASNFYPKPKITSSVITIKAKKNINHDYEKLDLILRYSFFSRRKKIKNNLIKYFPDIKEIFEKNRLNQDLRPQDFTTDEFILMSKILDL